MVLTLQHLGLLPKLLFINISFIFDRNVVKLLGTAPYLPYTFKLSHPGCSYVGSSPAWLLNFDGIRLYVCKHSVLVLENNWIAWISLLKDKPVMSLMGVRLFCACTSLCGFEHYSRTFTVFGSFCRFRLRPAALLDNFVVYGPGCYFIILLYRIKQ